MKIGQEIYYKLYHSTLDLKLEKAEEDMKIFQITFKSIKDILKSYKPYIDTQVNTLYGVLLISPSYNVKGKLSERYVHNDILYTKEIFFKHLKAYKNNFDRIKKHKAYIHKLEKQRISYALYKKIIKKFNTKVSYAIVFEQYKFNLGYHLGKLFIAHKTASKPIIDWGRSYKKRDKIVEEGKIPYYKEDFLEAEKEGIEYKGVKWLIEHGKDDVWIHHELGNIKSYKLRLVRASGNNISQFIKELRNSKGFNVKNYPFIKKIKK